MSWEILKIEDFADVIGGGTPSTKNNSYWNGDIPWIGPRDLSNWSFKYIDRGDRNISNLGLEKSSAKLLPVKTVLMTSRAPIGYVAIAKNEICTNQGFQNLVCKENIADPNFVYYLIKEHIDKIKAVASGATFPEISKTKLKGIELTIPPLQTQKRIADILSAYDDLIENNLKRIKLLEQAAQNIYKEWFVNLRFPGHENTSINQETGLPEGFEEKSLSDLVSKITDGTHDSPKPKDKGFYLVTGKNINNGFLDFSNAYLISKEDHDKVQKRSFLELGDILYSNIGTIGSTTIVDQDFKYSCKNVIIFKPLEFHSFFLYCFLTNTHTKSLFLQGLAGSSQKFISLTYARGYKEIFPSTDSIVLFHNTVKDFFKQKKLLHVQNQKLKAARDILLPRLMNRTIEV
jgi:type I restriction enzyme, S subunit